MATSFLSPLLADFHDQVAKFSADVEAAAEQAKLNILRELDGLTVAATGNVARLKPAALKVGASKATREHGQKRTPADLANAVEQVFNVISKHPGERIEQLAARIALPTKDMALPIKKLRADKRVVVKGQKRATTYRVK